jgi:Zn-dependent protease
MPTFYHVDSTRSPMREYWWGSKNPIILLLAFITKLFRIPMPMSSDDPNADTTLDSLFGDLPPEILERFAPISAELAELGFHNPVYHFIEDHGSQTRWYWADYLHDSGEHWARIHFRQWFKSTPYDRGLFPLFITEFTDGTFLVSSAGKPDVSAPESVEMNRMPKTPTRTLWETHPRHAAKSQMLKAIKPVRSTGDLIQSCERLHVLQRDFHLARKFFRSRTEEEQRNAEIFTARVEEHAATGMQHPAIMAELNRLQDRKPKWNSGIWILIISVIVFFAAGTAKWDSKFTLYLIPILLFHEMGHWVAMRIFKYRNLRMFFIPLFGAAVTGQNWNVPGWKKAMVSLAGPLPGIVLGAALGIIGMVMNKPPLKEVAYFLILLNGFNLLPVLPLDGGHFLHAVLFSRNRWLDITFRVAAVVALISLTVFGIGRFLVYIGIAIAVGLPVAFKMAKVTDYFRKHPLPPPFAGEDRIPAVTAETLITAVKAEMPKATSNTAIAQNTLNVFETLNARPPGVLATFALLGLYGGSIVLSVVIGLLVVLSKEGDLKDFFSAALRQPKQRVECSGYEVWRGPEVAEKAGVHLIVTHFENAPKARAEFDRLKTEVPKDAAVTCFGGSLILAIPTRDPAVREHWVEEMEARSTNTFVVVSNNSLGISLSFVAPNANVAATIENEVNDYFGAPAPDQLIPPWGAGADSAALDEARKARHLWWEMTAGGGSVWTNAALKQYGPKITQARRRGDTGEMKRLIAEQQKRAAELENEKRELIKARHASTPLAELVSLEEQYSSPDLTNRTERLKLQRRISDLMGPIAKGEEGASAGFGSISRHGLMLEAPWVTVHDPAKNLPLLLDWICKKQCIDVKYELVNFSLGTDEPEEDEEK